MRRQRGALDVTLLLASGGFATLFVASVTGYLNLTHQVTERPTVTEVRQIIEDKTVAKQDEILRRLDRFERQLDRLTQLTLPPSKK